jgi:hypothetical protein
MPVSLEDPDLGTDFDLGMVDIARAIPRVNDRHTLR